MKVLSIQRRRSKAIMEIYALARKFMKEQGNPTQWERIIPANY